MQQYIVVAVETHVFFLGKIRQIIAGGSWMSHKLKRKSFLQIKAILHVAAVTWDHTRSGFCGSAEPPGFLQWAPLPCGVV